MRTTISSILAGILCVLGPVATAPAGDREPVGPGPLPDAWLAPEDVTLCLHVEGAAELRANLARRPIARLVEGFMGSELESAWKGLAQPAGLDDAELFDLLLGRRFTLFVRAGEAGAPDWALVTRADPVRVHGMLERLAPRRLAPIAGLPVAELPEQELRLSRNGSRYLIGPADGPLFDVIVPRLAAGPPAAGADRGLADEPALVKSRTMGRAAAALFVRHGAPLEGWSVVVADVDGDKVAMRHRGSFGAPLIARPLTNLSWDMSALDAIEDVALLAVIEPTDIGGGGLEMFAQVALGRPFIDAVMRTHVDESRIIALGEVEGRQQENRADMLVPTGAVAVKMQEHEFDVHALDQAVAGLAEAMKRIAGDADPLQIPGPDECAGGAPRHIDLGPVMKQFGGGHPILDAVSLNWRVARGAAGSYYVVATHPEQLELVAGAIENCQESKTRSGRWASCGSLNGRRLARHLESYSAEVARLATQTPEDAATFRSIVLNLSRLCDGMDRCRWQLRRPSANDITLDVQVELSEPDSVVEDGPGEHRPADGR